MSLDLATVTVVVVRLFLVVTMLGIGLRIGADRAGVPAGITRWLAAMLAVNVVVIPIIGTLACLALGLRGDVAVAVIACAVAPAGSLAPKLVELAGGDLRRAVLATFVLSVLATLTVPPSIALGAGALGLAGETTAIDVAAVIRSLAIFQLAPMLVGIAIARGGPGLGRRLGPPTMVASNALMVAVVIVALADTGDDLAAVGPGPALAMAVVASAGLAIGRWLGRADVAVGRASALVTAQRAPGLALLVVAGPGQPMATATVVVATVTLVAINLAAALASGRWRRAPVLERTREPAA